MKDKYTVVYDIGHACDGAPGGNTIAEAKSVAMEIVMGWIGSFSGTVEDWEDMIYSCSVEAWLTSQLGKEGCSPKWEPSSDDLFRWGFTLTENMDDAVYNIMADNHGWERR